MLLSVAFAVILLLGLVAYVRLAPSDPSVWNVDPSRSYSWDQGDGWDEVILQTNGAMLRLKPESASLDQIDAIAIATSRTVRLTGSVAGGRITWVTRSKLWGFPDYTTAEAKPDGIYIHARLRFGSSDLGVNAARLRDWLTRL